jgi:asparagine synthase (glutamine-hydrolysing)
MCGIAGIVSSEPLAGDATARATRMRDVLTHRGPDDAGLRVDEFAVLAHRRLSIIDLKSGQQPLSNEDGRVWTVFNGEIYNHADVRRLLQQHGHQYRTRSDTESIVHAYEEWGDECMHRFRGMFAFAIWDAAKRRLLLVRDRLGVKPLYWAQTGRHLVFGSEIKAILASGLVTPEGNNQVVSELLSTRSIAGEETMFRGVKKLLPGHLLVFEDGRVRTRQYWDVPAGRRAHAPRSASPVEEFRERLKEAVRLRLMSDVPLGVFLSGGLDSSAIAALAAGLIDRPLQTFSVAFKERAFSELGYATTVAKAIGADSHEIVIDDRDFFGALPRLIWHEDEPISHPSSIPLYFVSSLARRHVTVVLTGEGSDELLAGYGKYQRAEWNWHAGIVYERLVPAALRSAVARRGAAMLPRRLQRLAGRSFLTMPPTPAAMFFDNFAAVRLADQRALLAQDIHADPDEQNAYRTSVEYFNQPPDGSTLLDRLLYSDMKTYLVELLMRQDQMSMAASIESRVPFLDHELVEFSTSLPDEWKRSGWTTKRVLRKAMEGLLPESILRRPKMGFPVPFARWTRATWNPVVRDVLLDSRSRQRGLFNPAAVEQLVTDHAHGRVDGGDRIWSLLNIELWHRTFIDKEGIQTLAEPSVQEAPARTHAHSVAEV